MIKLLFYSLIILIPLFVAMEKIKKGEIEIIGYYGLVVCFILGVIGTAKGMNSISKYVSGTAISTPRIANRSIIGTVICEAGLVCTLLHCIGMFMKITKMENTYKNNYILLASGITVGAGFFYSSVTVGIICSAISMMDAKDSKLFFKIFILEIIPASIGLIGMVIGVVINEKVK